MRTVCTIITPDYIPFANVLCKSLKKFIPDINLQILVTGEIQQNTDDSIITHTLDSVINSSTAKGIYNKYAHTNKDHFRWALKPVFISYLLNKGFDKILYVDNDLFFVNNFEFLFDELDKYDILLTPHWTNITPLDNGNGLLDVLQGGLYNAGFIGVNKNAIEAINWWADACHYKTEKNYQLGLFVDQKYLDVLPAQFDNVKVIKHQGCNLASWNIQTCKRSIINNQVMINQKYEPVFIHFNRETITAIFNKQDRYLETYLDQYINSLKEEGFDIHNNQGNLDFSKFNSPIFKIKRKLLLRTRLKRFLFKLAQKL